MPAKMPIANFIRVMRFVVLLFIRNGFVDEDIVLRICKQ